MMQTAAVQKISEQNSPYKAMLDRAYMIGYTDAMNQERSHRRAARDRRERKKCVLCGGWYIPKSNRAKYCPECAKEEERRKTRERVRRHRAAM